MRIADMNWMQVEPYLRHDNRGDGPQSLDALAILASTPTHSVAS